MPKSTAPSTPININEIIPSLLRVLASEAPIRLVKSGKLDGLFPSAGGRNKQLIESCVNSAPALLDRVGPSGSPDPKAQHVRLTVAGMEAIANNLPIAEVEHATALAAADYRNAFRDACLRATENRILTIRDRVKRLIADNRTVLDVAQRALDAQIAAIEAEKASIVNTAAALTAPSHPNALEPCRDRDYEFIQHAAGLLLLEWRNSKQPDVRAVLEGIMASLSIKRVGVVGETVAFDARTQDTTDDAELNSAAIVLESGWQLKTQRGPILLLKATVRPLSSGANTRNNHAGDALH